MEWKQQSGARIIASTDGRWIIQPSGREYILLTADGYAAWLPRPTIAACKRQAEQKSAK